MATSTTPAVAPYGKWTSPITSTLIAAGSTELNEVHVSPSGEIYLVEGRPASGGGSTIVEFKWDEKTGGITSSDLLPTKYNVSGKLHGYGGGAAVVGVDRRIIFTDANSNGVFLSEPGSSDVKSAYVLGSPRALYADFDVQVDGNGILGDWILAVKEESFEDGREEKNYIVAIHQIDKREVVVVEGADFYSHPRFSKDGKKVAWVQWFHPDMPWTGSELYVADWNGGEILKGKYVAGKASDQAICQPRWGLDGDLWFVNDPNGIWQMFRYNVKNEVVEPVVLKGYEDVEIGAREQKLGNTTYIQLSKEKWLITYCREASNGLIVYDIPTDSVTELPLDLVDIAWRGLARMSDTEFAVIGSTPTTPRGLYVVNISKPTSKILLKSSSSIALPPSTFSPLKSISFPRTHGTPGISYAVFSPPSNPSFTGPQDQKPPLIVSIHGGPTSDVKPGLDLETQYFTSRGYAYVHVNYTGSIGFGRAYRQALNHNWGIKDIEDTLSCIDFLSSQNLIDPSKVGIRGGSAGGYTVLQALATRPKVFAAGCSLYGVGNMQDLASKTHKFESHYLFDLLFPRGASEEERQRVYRERSPCYHAERIERPLVLLQGDRDVVVPLEQSTDMERVLRGLGKDVRLVVYEGEGHGWEKSETIKASIEEEERLWERTLVV